jgi:hypothetical protein
MARVDFAIEDPIPVGPHELSVIADVAVTVIPNAGFADFARRTVTLAAPFQVLENVQTIVSSTAPADVLTYRSALRIGPLGPASERKPSASLQLDGSLELWIQQVVHNGLAHKGSYPLLDFGAAYDVFLRTPAGEIPAGGFVHAPRLNFSTRLQARIPPAMLLETRHVDVILRPSFNRAVRHTDIERWLDAELVFERVPITPVTR